MPEINTVNLDVDARFNEMINELARQHPCRVLYLEDDVNAAQQVESLFESNPAVDFHHARGPLEADEILRSTLIDIVVVDINLGTGIQSGEDWILRNREILTGKLVVILSGHVGQIQELAVVKKMVAQIIERGEEEHRELWQFPTRMALHRAAEAVQGKVEKMEVELQEGLRDLGVKPSISSGEGKSLKSDEALRRAIAGLFRQWAEKIPDQSRGLIYMGDKILSASDLVHEVELGTKTGNTFLRLFTEDLSELV